jgi:hypothetical protein
VKTVPADQNKNIALTVQASKNNLAAKQKKISNPFNIFLFKI